MQPYSIPYSVEVETFLKRIVCPLCHQYMIMMPVLLLVMVEQMKLRDVNMLPIPITHIRISENSANNH